MQHRLSATDAVADRCADAEERADADVTKHKEIDQLRERRTGIRERAIRLEINGGSAGSVTFIVSSFLCRVSGGRRPSVVLVSVWFRLREVLL